VSFFSQDLGGENLEKRSSHKTERKKRENHRRAHNDSGNQIGGQRRKGNRRYDEGGGQKKKLTKRNPEVLIYDKSKSTKAKLKSYQNRGRTSLLRARGGKGVRFPGWHKKKGLPRSQRSRFGAATR